MFLCRGAEAPAGFSVQGGARDDALGPGDSLFPWAEDVAAVSQTQGPGGCTGVGEDPRECGAVNEDGSRGEVGSLGVPGKG